MKAIELRIGNLVYSFKDTVSEVLGISTNNVGLKWSSTEFLQANFAQISPIPITKEWLIKMGFEANIIIYSHPKNRRLAVKLWDDPKIKFILFWKNLVIRELDVFYVHQLQNLFYSLTGEELKIS